MNTTKPIELAELMSFSKDRYLKNIIIQLAGNHPDLEAEITELLQNSHVDKANDHINQLLENANLPCYPEHETLENFNESCLTEEDRLIFESIQKPEYLKLCNPNIIIYGPPGFGREHVASGLGDLFCKRQHKVFYINFDNLIIGLQTRTSNKSIDDFYKRMLTYNCLIINDFAGIYLYDADLITRLTLLIQGRYAQHQKSFFTNKKNPSRPMHPFATVVTSSYPPAKWTEHFKTDPMEVLKLTNTLYGCGKMLVVDESNSLEADSQSTS